MFRVGQKVVYIGPDCSSVDGRLGQKCPVRGAVYTVRGNTEVSGTPAIYLFEIVNEKRWWGDGFHELAMDRAFFRPIQERKTDISCFTDILDKVSRGDLVEVR